MNARLIISLMCAAEILSMTGTFSFPTLLPRLLHEWGLSNAEAGWINGAYFAGYTLAVPVLAGLTDRIDGKRIFILFSAIGGLTSIGFAIFAQGFWTALIFRTLGGLGLAGTFIPGLKALVDRLDGHAQARAISFYTATFSLGMSLSFFSTGVIGDLYGWRIAFTVAGVVTMFAIPLAFAALKSKPRPAPETRKAGIRDFILVLKNRDAMGYILAYACHMWEMFTFRSWIVAFLTFSLGGAGMSKTHWSPPTIAALAGVVCMWTSVGGAELALKFGGKKIITLLMWSSALIGCLIGFGAGLPYPVIAALSILYTAFLQADSAALHTGVILSAKPERRGTAMAFQSLLGFGAAAAGPLAVGKLLDLTGGGQTVMSWGLSFLSMGVVAALGPPLLRLMTRKRPS